MCCEQIEALKETEASAMQRSLSLVLFDDQLSSTDTGRFTRGLQRTIRYEASVGVAI